MKLTNLKFTPLNNNSPNKFNVCKYVHGVISPLLANLFLHYAFDMWLSKKNNTIEFARYADDAIIHCRSKRQAEWLLKAIEERMQECGLELHKDKTKLVYCKDYRRQGDHPQVKFDFLGYSFQPRISKSTNDGKLFLGYDCAISIGSKKRLIARLREFDIPNLTFKSIVGIAQYLNPYIRGWVNYYGKFRGYEMNQVFQNLRRRLVFWARKRYKRYKTSINRAYDWLERVRKQFPYLFYHWQIGLCN
jgi:RNA-directed DNA polymerase